MRRLPLLVLLPLLLGAKPQPTPVVFVGLDYSLARFIGAGDFRQPELLFPGFLEAWNQEWADEMMRDLDRAIGPVTLSGSATRASNLRASAPQILAQDGPADWVDESHISRAALAELVAGYSLPETAGLGLVLVVDRYLKAQETGCSWIVYFDIGSRELRTTTRACARAGGIGFRTYWFRTEANLLGAIKRAKPGG